MPAGEGKIELILQFLHDHSRLVCQELNKKAGAEVWKTTPLTDGMRRNLIFHYGNSGFNLKEKVNKENQKLTPRSPTIVVPEVIERNEEIIKFCNQKSKQKSRLTVRKQLNTTGNGIFSRPIRSRQVEVIKQSIESPKPGNLISVSTSSIYVDKDEPQSDYEHELFHEPSDLEMASFYHNQHQSSQWFQDHSLRPDLPEDDSNWQHGSLEFALKPKSTLKIYSQPF